MILKSQTTNAISLKLLLIFFSLPLIFKSQNTIPTTTVSGCLKVDSTMSTSGNLVVSGTGRIDSSFVVRDTMKAQDVVVSGNAKIAGDVSLGGKLLYNAANNIGIGFKQGASVNTGTFTYGKQAAGFSPVPCAAAPASGYNHAFGGILQIFDIDGLGNYQPNSGLLNFQTWTGGSSIDASTGGNVSASGLLLNFFLRKQYVY